MWRNISQRWCRPFDTLFSARFRFLRVGFKRRFTIPRCYGKHILNINRECIPREDARGRLEVLYGHTGDPVQRDALSFNCICFPKDTRNLNGAFQIVAGEGCMSYALHLRQTRQSLSLGETIDHDRGTL